MARLHYVTLAIVVLCVAVSGVLADNTIRPKTNVTTEAPTTHTTTAATTHTTATNHTTGTTATKATTVTTAAANTTTGTTVTAGTGTSATHTAGTGTSTAATGTSATGTTVTVIPTTPGHACPPNDTSSLKAGIAVLSVLCALLFIAVIYLFIRMRRLADQFRYSNM